MAGPGNGRVGAVDYFFLSLLFAFLLLPKSSRAQFQNGTSKFEQKLQKGEEELREEIRSHDDVKEYFFPEKLFADVNIYRTEIPLSQDFTIGVIGVCSASS